MYSSIFTCNGKFILGRDAVNLPRVELANLADEVIHRLFFADPNAVLSSGITFDPTLR